ncbi:MAG: hypothetical protein K2K25_06700 [Muribaculaceae bacterium]|nr:hypothetical protein [Muribaculaceae bacterium]
MEKENDIIYDLDAIDAEKAEIMEIHEDSEESEESEESDKSDKSDQSDKPDLQSEPSDASEEDEKSPAEAELQKMLEEMGAETLVEIIKDNRNAAIKQIISEVQSSQPRALGSGTSVTSTCQSIFDLAAMA